MEYKSNKDSFLEKRNWRRGYKKVDKSTELTIKYEPLCRDSYLIITKH